MSRVMSATQVRTHFGQVMREVASTGEPVIVERGGEPVVAIVPMGDLELLLELKSAKLSPANRAVLKWLAEWKETPDSAGPEWWDEFELELNQNPTILGRER